MGWFSRHFSSQSRAAEKPQAPSATKPAAQPESAQEPSPPAPIPDQDSAPPSTATSTTTSATLPELKNIPTAGIATDAVSWMQRDGVNADFLAWLFEGGGESGLFANRLEQGIVAEVEKAVNSKTAGTDMVRRMPGVIPQLLQSLRTEEFSGAELARQISNDVVLVAEVIRIANSSLYKTNDEITSIERAVLVLGHTGLRQLITSVAFKPIIDLKSGHFTKTIAPKIWSHSEKCARANRVLAEGETVQAFEAFLSGLIQNVGLIVSLRFIDQLAGTQSIGSAGFCNSLVSMGRKLSIGIAREWHFPGPVIRAIEEQSEFKKNADMSPIGAILATGDYISKIQILSEHQRLNPEDPDVIDGLSPKAVHCLNELIK